MKFERSDINSIGFYDYETRAKIPCEIADDLEFKFNTEVKVPVELLKEIDTQRLNCQLMKAGIIGITLSVNVIVHANLNDFLEESFKVAEVRYMGIYKNLPYTFECKNTLVTKVEYDDGQPELENDALLLDFAEVFNEVPSLYADLLPRDRYFVSIDVFE